MASSSSLFSVIFLFCFVHLLKQLDGRRLVCPISQSFADGEELPSLICWKQWLCIVKTVSQYQSARTSPGPKAMTKCLDLDLSNALEQKQIFPFRRLQCTRFGICDKTGIRNHFPLMCACFSLLGGFVTFVIRPFVLSALGYRSRPNVHFLFIDFNV